VRSTIVLQGLPSEAQRRWRESADKLILISRGDVDRIGIVGQEPSRSQETQGNAPRSSGTPGRPRGSGMAWILDEVERPLKKPQLKSELVAMTRIDFASKVWTIPGERIKAGREHRIPLSTPTLSLLKRRHATRSGDGWVFPGVRKEHLSNNAMLALLDRMKRGAITAHGFRSSFRDWAAEQTNFPREVAEMALAHAIGDKVEAAYRRGDLFTKRVKLMDAWASYALAGPRHGQVVSLRKESA
jgi:hypothetical protein